MSSIGEKILEVQGLDVTFRSAQGNIHALRGVDLTLNRGETIALVGESGSGKSVTMKAVAGLLPSGAVINGGTAVLYGEDGEHELLHAERSWMRRNINGKRIAMVYQDSMTSLNPTMTIGDQLITSIRTHADITKKEARLRALDYLREVGITDPERRLSQYPHQFSGGMRQRIVIAIALSCDPEILICDEPTTALDVTIQEKILELIISLQRKRGLSVIYITHDLGVVAKVADHVYVMYAGRVIERGTVFDVFYDPRHPYTWGLLSAIPDPDTEGDELYSIHGTPPVLSKEPEGDAFAPRNPYALGIDFKQEAPMFRVSETHYAATWLLDPRAPKTERPAALQRRIDRMKKEAEEYVHT